MMVVQSAQTNLASNPVELEFDIRGQAGRQSGAGCTARRSALRNTYVLTNFTYGRCGSPPKIPGHALSPKDQRTPAISSVALLSQVVCMFAITMFSVVATASPFP